MKISSTKSSVESVAVVALAAGLAFTLNGPVAATAQPAVSVADQIVLSGTVRDFTSSHPDFGVVSASQTGNYSPSVARSLDLAGLPIYTGAGRRVTSQWYDKDGYPIAPYGDPGLVGGHFDVDVYDVAPSTSEVMHTHQFDDKYNVTYVDVVNDTKLLFDDIVGGYPNDLRMEFLNPHNGGGGTYVFEADAGEIRGYTGAGFTATFSPSQLLQLRIDFMTLADMRQTSPGTTQDDAADRDDSLSIRMYDVTTDELVYELAVYNHFKPDKPYVAPDPVAASGNDSCGVPLNDTVGSFGSAGNGAVKDSSSFRDWFRDVPGTNLAARHDITLTRNGAGVYEYATTEFFPVDGQLYGNGGGLHNDLFTYSMSVDFTYNACTDQFLEMASSDDVWVYINGELVIDLGGVGDPQNQRVTLDRLGLTDGQDYTIEMFYAKRQPADVSIFGMRTNLALISPYAQLPMSSGLFD
jgi:fibro-slime domain-containing protein